MSYFEYTATPAALEALNAWHEAKMKGYSPVDAAAALAADLRALSEGRAVELGAGETKSGVPELFRLDLEDPRYFTKAEVLEDEDD